MQTLYKISCTLLFLIVTVNACLSQYINEKGKVDEDKIISELKQFQDGSSEQRAYADSLAFNLAREIVSHPALKKEENGRSHEFRTVHLIQRRMGDFTFLRSEGSKTNKTWWETDTVSTELKALESNIEALKDSLHTLYEQLIEITRRGDAETRATKEKAAHLIGKSPFRNHIEYVFENDSALTFGLIVNERYEPIDCFGCYRSGMIGLTVGLNRDMQKHNNWRHFPLLLKYWGNPKLPHQGDSMPYELGFFVNMTNGLKNVHLLLEFMRSNAEDPDTPIYQHLSRYFSE